MEKEDIRSSFIRQRRNLILVCLTLLFSLISGLTLEKLNVFGNELKLAHPYSINFFLWIGLAYWALRYKQYLYGLGDLGFKSTYLANYHHRMNGLALKKLFKLKDPVTYPPEDCLDGKVTLTIDNNYGYRLDTPDHVVLRLDIRKKVTSRYHSSDQQISNVKITLSKWDLLPSKIKSLFHVLFNTHLFTEYYLPYLLIIPPLIIQLSLI